MITFAILILIVAKALPGLNTQISSIHVIRITSIVFLFAGALTLNTLNLESIGSGIGIYCGFFQLTTISQLIEIFLFMIGGGILIAWPQIKQGLLIPSLNKGVAKQPAAGGLVLIDNKELSTDYSIVVLFSSLGSSLLISSYDLISIYLSIELQSFGLYVLSTLYRDSESSTSAGLKYFLLGGLSSCIILLGLGIIYSYTGTTNLESLYIINSIIDSSINQQELYIIQGISLGLSLIFIGFLFKIAAAPLHNWSPDVYDGTPTIVTTWLTIIPKIAILFILLELQIKLGSFGLLLNHPALWGDNILKTLLLISATLSLIIGSLLGLAQIRIKRLLAYSTISHIGFILLALAVNTEQSIDSFIFYIIQYTITNLNIFLIILGLTYYTLRVNNAYPPFLETTHHSLPDPLGGGSGNLKRELSTNGDLNSNLSLFPAYSSIEESSFRPLGMGGRSYKDISFISEFKGLFFKYPLLSISLAVSLFSMAGIPPLLGFFSKQLVLYSALQNGYYFISFLAIIVSVISCSYYLQIIKVLITPAEGAGEDSEITIYLKKEQPNLVNEKARSLTTLGKKDSSLFKDKVVPLGGPCLTPPKIEVNSSYPFKLFAYQPFNKGEGGPLIFEGGAGQGAMAALWGDSSIGGAANEGWSYERSYKLSNIHSYLISTLTFTILLFFIKPSLILNSTQLLSLSLFYI